MLAGGADAPVSSSVRVGCFCVFGPCPMKSVLTGQLLVDPAVMDVERFGNRDRCSARREHFGLIGSAAARSGRPASGSHGAGGYRGPDQGGLGREHGVRSPRPGGCPSWSGLPDRRSLPPRACPPGRSGTSPASPATLGGCRPRSRPGERRLRPGIRRRVTGTAACRASRPPLWGAGAASVRGRRSELGCQPLVLRAAVRPAYAPR